MKEKKFFKNSKGNKLCGILSNPSGDKEKPIVILCHGFTTNKDAYTCIRLEELLNNEVISTFRMDFYGHGESEGKFEDITITESVDDVLCAIGFLRGLGYRKLGIFGSSFGGFASIMASSKTRGLFCLALKSPVSDYGKQLKRSHSTEAIREWKSRGFIYYMEGNGNKHKLNYSFYDDSRNNDGYGNAKNIKTATLIVHGENDDDVLVEQSKKLSRVIENCRLEVIKGADHRYSRPEDFERMIMLVSEFIIKTSREL